MLKKLINIPAGLLRFINNTPENQQDLFFTSDPDGQKIGSGGGVVHILVQKYIDENPGIPFEDWLEKDKFLIINSGGHSRRLPSYSHLGKINIPVPVFRWAIGQDIDQTLLDFQIKFYNKILTNSPSGLKFLIGSGDVLLMSEDRFDDIPEADIVCFGIWTEDEVASKHGVFLCKRDEDYELSFMLQKPEKKILSGYLSEYFYLTDSGLWLLSSKAMKILFKSAGLTNLTNPGRNSSFEFFDLYSGFGKSLGKNPGFFDSNISDLKVRIYPLRGGEFYHFGSSKDLVSSCTKIQNKIHDQREIIHFGTKPHPSIFVLNSELNSVFNETNQNIWIENSFINSKCILTQDNFITGLPENDWDIRVDEGICIDIVPIREFDFCVRIFKISDSFSSSLDKGARWMGVKLSEWLFARDLDFSCIMADTDSDIISYKLFPVMRTLDRVDELISWISGKTSNDKTSRDRWMSSERFSFEEINEKTNFSRVFKQKDAFKKSSLKKLSENYKRSVFYQLDLKKTAEKYKKYGIGLPGEIDQKQPLQRMIHDQMFRSVIVSSYPEKNILYKHEAFRLLKDGILSTFEKEKVCPQRNILDDQIIWGRSPVRLDLAGGWTDTPPYCIFYGGSVINIAVDLNGQPPLQVFVRSVPEHKIVFKSIDLGVQEIIESFEHLRTWDQVGSPFSIAKAAMAMAGFDNCFSSVKYISLKDQLKELGCGIEVSVLSAVPKGSGLGTSSIIAATLLGTLSEAFNLGWDKSTICNKTLALEQMLTTGGGWQDQYGGIFHGLKEINSIPGFFQQPSVKWLPGDLFESARYNGHILLYYTGITRVAKTILEEIVKGMFLNSADHLEILKEMKLHASDTFNVIQKGDYYGLSGMILKTWDLNNKLDSGTNTPSIQGIINNIKDYSCGYKLLGAGGGGFFLIMSKDMEAARKIRKVLDSNRPNERARFVDLSISSTGFVVSKS
jgi:galactokinase/mevalonate kinase-like predicted kinase